MSANRLSAMRTLVLAFLFALTPAFTAEPLRIAVFKADATPEIGMPVAYGEGAVDHRSVECRGRCCWVKANVKRLLA